MAAAAFVNAYNRSDPLNEKAPLASMEDLSVVDTPMDTPGASPRSQRARWSLHRSSIGSQLDPLIEDVVSSPKSPATNPISPSSSTTPASPKEPILAGNSNSNLREFVDVEEELRQPMLTSTPLKSEPGKHLFQKKSQRFGSPSRLQGHFNFISTDFSAVFSVECQVVLVHHGVPHYSVERPVEKCFDIQLN